MKKSFFALISVLLLCGTAMAQRFTDKLDRGLVAVPANVNGGSGSGNFVSWRIFGEEYYDVTYNLYCNGTLLKEGLKVSCYTHTAGTATSKYQVAAVVNGVEQGLSAEVTRWNGGYFDILVASVTDRAGANITSMYELNDISLGDVNGDGITEFIVKRNYVGSDPSLTQEGNKTRFNLYECYDLSGNRLWSIDLGPNLMAGPDEQWDLVAYDWDMDGKAECIMRGADNMIIHTATGRNVKIGNMNYYAPRDEYTRYGAEYLLYINGETGEPYGWDGTSDAFTPMAYPLPRFEKGEAADVLNPTGAEYEAVWGKNDTGHRATKHYFGAPYLDGRKPSIFLGRGCYTRHKMCALDVDPATHTLTQRWRWNQYSGGSPWFGNGYHNYQIADVDWDGRDEIMFGSMVIDDNGLGLCTTGLGHGDAQHCSDLDPYRHGQEQFICNETSPACTYWNATTGKFYYRLASSGDDGRALAGNFSNSYPGSMGRTTQTGLVSLTADKVIDGGPATGGTNDALFWSHLNQRIYWDGDLCDEVMDSPGSAAREGAIYKPEGGRVFTTTGCNTSNSSKNNPGAIADIFGDWREELVMRAENNTRIRIWTTAIPTTYRLYTLWHDHQYRNAMVWQCVGYNQPPHKSYFVGQMEGITIAPPPLTTTGRTVMGYGATINSEVNGQHVLVTENDDITLSVANGATPSIVTFYVPSWVQGTNSNIVNGIALVNRTYYTCRVTDGAFSGSTRIVKQGDGILTLPAVEQTYSGNTDIWAGTLNFDGKLLNSSLWLNRFAELNSDGGQFRRIKMDYASILRPGGADKRGDISTDSLQLGFGSRLQLDLYGDGVQADKISTRLLTVETKMTGNWLTYGPKYLAPVIEVVPHAASGSTELAAGKYLIADGVETVTGKLSNIIIEGVSTKLKTELVQEDDKIYLVLSEVRQASDIVWLGAESNVWQFGGEDNFRLSDVAATATEFVTGDIVRFTDESTRTSVSLKGDIEADSIIVDASKNYSFIGTGSIIAGTKLIKRGTGMLTVSTDNTYTGGTRISGGVLSIGSLSNENQERGHLGGVTTAANKCLIENGAELRITAAVTMGSPMFFAGDEGGVINTSADLSMNKSFSGTTLTKTGSAWIKQYGSSSLKKAVIAGGAIQTYAGNPAITVEFQGGAVYDEAAATSFAINVPKGKTGTLYMTNTYYTAYSNTLTGEGTFTYVPRNTVSRVRITGNWAKFAGTIKHTTKDIWLPLDMSGSMPNGTLDIAEGCTVTNVAKTFAIGCVTGKGSLAHPVANFQNSTAVTGNNTWQVGNNTTDFTFSGTFTDGGGSNKTNFAKIGSCKMTVSGASNHSGTTQVNAGELHFGTTATLGKGALTVARGAVLSGATATNKSLTNSAVTVSNGGTLQVGASTSAISGQIDFGGANVTMAKGSILKVGVGRAATASNTGCTALQNINRLAMNATIQLHYSSSLNLAVGDSVVLWRNVTTVSGTPVLADYYIAPGLFWDDTDLARGILRVTDVAPVGIQGVEAATPVEVEVVSANGTVVATYATTYGNVTADLNRQTLPRGIYILRITARTGVETRKVRL
ncbi:MAG: autotransporter-associated beta strand repeat-containing protein [Bacteroidaceae bacterium]|nr:autotransporter-associated beta strand repeat-containing protein [Bacteroidaceae bacterium]